MEPRPVGPGPISPAGTPRCGPRPRVTPNAPICSREAPWFPGQKGVRGNRGRGSRMRRVLADPGALSSAQQLQGRCHADAGRPGPRRVLTALAASVGHDPGPEPTAPPRGDWAQEAGGVRGYGARATRRRKSPWQRPSQSRGPRGELGSKGPREPRRPLPFLQGHPLGPWDPSSLEVPGGPGIKLKSEQSSEAAPVPTGRSRRWLEAGNRLFRQEFKGCP